jgi:hypothetical protein
MPFPEENSVEERNKTLMRPFIEEIFNEHNLFFIEEYFDKIQLKIVLWQGRVVKYSDSS